MRSPTALVVLVALVAHLTPSTANAVFECPSPLGLRWCGAFPIVIRIDYDASLSSPQGQAIQDAIESSDGTSGAVPEWNFETTNGDCIPIALTTLPFATPYVVTVSLKPLKDSDTWAETQPYGDGSRGVMNYATVKFNSAKLFNGGLWNWTTSPQFARRVAMHELGHVLGLADAYSEARCSGTLMFGYSDPLDPSPTIDGGAAAALRSIYGDGCNDVCNHLVMDYIINLAPPDAAAQWRMGAYSGCVNPSCPAGATVAGADAGSTASSTTYELAVSDSSGFNYTTFATFSDSVWSSGHFAYGFPSAHNHATVRLRAYNGALLVHEAYTYPPVDFPATLDVPQVAPSRIALSVSPNPAVHGVTVGFELDQTRAVGLGIFDVSGRRIARLVDGSLATGPHVIKWSARGDDGAPVRTGVYFVRLTSGGRVVGTASVVVQAATSP